MKFFRTVVMLFLAIGVSQTSHAQFFKKLKKKVENAVEQTVINKTSEKAAKETEKAMDKAFDMDFGNMYPNGSMGSMENIPAKYDFEWVYELELESPNYKKNEGELFITYFLKEGAPYWAAEFNSGAAENMMMVYDAPTNQMIMLLDQKGEKMAVATELPDLETAQENEMQDYKMTKISGKTILGKDCEGYKMENDEYEFTMYVTFDTKISFSDIYGKNQQIPKNFDASWLKKGDNEGLLMEMQMIDKSKQKNNMNMKCVRLEKNNFSINTTAYKSLGQ